MYSNFFKNSSTHPTNASKTIFNKTVVNKTITEPTSFKTKIPTDPSQSLIKNIFSFIEGSELTSSNSIIKKILDIVDVINQESNENETSEEEYYQKPKVNKHNTAYDPTDDPTDNTANDTTDDDIYTDEMSTTEEDCNVIESEDSSERVKDLKKKIRENNLPKIIKEE